MPQSLVNLMVHLVFSTKERRPFITPPLAERLYPYLGGIARNNGFRLLASGGMPDHVHLLVSLSAILPLAKAVQLLKGNSSKWVHENFNLPFEWQRGYGAFSIGVSDYDRTVNYIRDQATHHVKSSFEDEYRAFLERNGVPFDERYVFD